MRMYNRFFAIAVFLGCGLAAHADSEGGLILGVEAEKSITKKWGVALEVDMRSRNNFRTMDRWGFGLGTGYKFNKYLKVDVGYKLLDYNMREKISYKTSGAYNHWRPSYWGIKHRVTASVTGQYKFPFNLKIALRERWQMTCRPEKTVNRWDFDDEAWEDKVRASRCKHQLRSRLEISYDKKRALFTPFASVELYNSWSLEKIRYTVGTDLRLSKQHSLTAFYRFQNQREVDEDEYDPDMHFIGLGYKFKF